MKFISYLQAIVLGLLAFSCEDIVAPVPPPGDISSGLVLYFPFDGTTFDFSGHGNNGSSANPQYTDDPLGRSRRAYFFNGSDNFISVPDSPGINPLDQITITMWLRIDSIQSNYMPVLVKGGPTYGYFNNREYGIWTKQDVELWYPEFKSAGDSSGMHELDSHLSYIPRRWNFFAFVVDRVSHSMQTYANGALTDETYDSYSTFNVNSSALIIGFSQEGLPETTPLRGAMDNLRVYGRALTPLQIKTLYSAHL